MALALLLPSLYSSSPAANRKCPNSRGLRPLFTLSQKEDRLCAVLRLPEGGVTLPGWLSDFTNAPFVRPSVAQSGGTVHRIGQFEITSAPFRRDSKPTRCFIAPVPADGAGGSALF